MAFEAVLSIPNEGYKYYDKWDIKGIPWTYLNLNDIHFTVKKGNYWSVIKKIWDTKICHLLCHTLHMCSSHII